MQKKSSYITILGIFTALAMILSFIETQIPTFISIPGIKLGLPNIAIIVILYAIGFKEALIVNIIRVVLTSLLFSNPITMLYGLSGGIVSIIIMTILKKYNLFSLAIISCAGAITHNICQILVAMFLTRTPQMIYYLPVLLLSATISGIIIGIIANIIYNRIIKITNLKEEMSKKYDS